MDFISRHYLVIKSTHIVFVICWMAALFYLPRLFCYHADQEVGSSSSQMLKVMEKKLTRIIMNPAMIMTYVFGILLLMIPGMFSSPMGWIHLKLLLVLIMSGFHGYMMVCLKRFSRDERPHSSKAFRMLNELPPLLMIIIVFLVVMKPF
ncbi:MAG: protoporphyrinogen oxidase HemJ [Alphaproteobacteria bacterium]|nr:protoporphyrinogen oxidase HemJ [Alphaproteobacteria bacterium]